MRPAVLLATALLAPALAADGAILVDATLGRAGHARALLEACPGLVLVGIDADVWSGFAFGFGIDRLAQMRHAIPDMRSFLENDIRFLSQF